MDSNCVSGAGVGEINCEKMHSLWLPGLMTDFLSTYSKGSQFNFIQLGQEENLCCMDETIRIGSVG